MKPNHHIDFFSSPNSKFFGFSDIRQPKEDIQPHEIHEDENAEQKKPFRKSSFSFMYQPIMPFGQQFFEEKLQECDEPSQYSQDRYNEIMRQDSQMKSPQIPENLLDPRPKFPPFNGNKFIDEQEYSDMFCDPNENKIYLQGKISPNLPDQFTTPKKKAQFIHSKRFNETTAQKTASRSTQKGLRRLSTLAYSIVNSSSPTTYKEVAQKLLSRLNFDCNDLDEEQCRAQKSSMQNVKRRVYDSLNVLIALGVINRSGNKITKQKEKKSFLSGNYSDLQKYNDLLNQYKKKLMNLQVKKKTQMQLQQKLTIFKRTIERNKKTKMITKNKLIRLPFLVFATKQLHNQQAISKNIEWVAKKIQEGAQKQKKKSSHKRKQMFELNQSEKLRQKMNQSLNDMMVKIKLEGFPESYGDLDFFKMIEQESIKQIKQKLRQNEQFNGQMKQKQIMHQEQYFTNPLQEEYEIQMYTVEKNNTMMNLIDEVLQYE